MLSRTVTRSRSARCSQTLRLRARPLSTLDNNPHIYVHPDPVHPSRHILSLLPTTPPTPTLSLGTTTALPPTPASFTTNPTFLRILSSTLAQWAPSDPQVQQQAAVFASPHGSPFLAPPSASSKRDRASNVQHSKSDDGSGGASRQGGAGGAGRGGHIHVSDVRAPPDWGRIAEPEDIFGSLEVDGRGEFVQHGEGEGVGNFQDSGTYRIVTRDGILGLTPFLREKLVAQLRKLESEGR